MKTWKIILIVVLILIAISAAYYFLVYKPGKESEAGQVESQEQQTNESQEPPQVQENEQKEIKVTGGRKNSVKVAYFETQEAPVPTKESLTNLLQSTWVLNAPPYIHHIAGPKSNCRPYIRYKNGYYKLISGKKDEQGYTTCYYKTIAI